MLGSHDQHHKLSAIGKSAVAPVNINKHSASPTAQRVLMRLPSNLRLKALNERKLRSYYASKTKNINHSNLLGQAVPKH